jgi:FkbM family methyltransferase
MKFISYAQNYEDVMLWRALKHVKSGFYVDVGANDPVEDSITKAFYDRGWRGVNIEPVTEWYKKLTLERPKDINLQVAAGDYDGELHLFEVVNTGLSTTNEDYAKKHAKDQGFEVCELTVPVQTLSTMLHKHNVSNIHFLKIDVEGSEQAVLKGLDLATIRPWVILIEATKPLTTIPDFDRWEGLITDKNYQFVYFDGLNRFYIANEHSELAQFFTVPPNYWDQYERFSEYENREKISSLEAQLGEQRATTRSLEISFNALDTSFRALDTSFKELMSSRSMKITEPLRAGLHVAKKIKTLPNSLPRKLVKAVVEQPRLRRIVKPIANRFPALQYRLSYLLHKDKSPIWANLSQLSDTDLSPRSARILQDLRRVVK